MRAIIKKKARKDIEMKGKRLLSEQIIRIINESEMDVRNIDICRQYGISEQTRYK